MTASRWKYLEPGELVLLLQYLQSPRISIVVSVSNFVQFGGHLESRIVQRCLCFLEGPTACKMRWTEPHPAAFKIAWLPPLYGLSQMFVQIQQWRHERRHMGSPGGLMGLFPMATTLFPVAIQFCTHPFQGMSYIAYHLKMSTASLSVIESKPNIAGNLLPQPSATLA